MAIVQKVAKIKGVADIVFCIDATGSMAPCIDHVKQNVENFASAIESNSTNTKVDWRAKILVYRDFGSDSGYLKNDFPFVTNAKELKSQLDQVTAEGGGDEPESTLDAILYATLKSEWRISAHKIVVVFTDATTKPNLDGKTIKELDIPDDFEVFAQVLMENHIKLFLYGQQCAIYDDLSKLSRTSIVQYGNAVEELKTADFKTILDRIGKTVSDIASGGEIL